MLDLGTLSYTPVEIEEKRTALARRFITLSPNIHDQTIKQIAVGDLKLLFDLYDEVFLGREFARNYRGRLQFSLSSRLTRSAGKTICSRQIRNWKPEEISIEIRIGVSFFFQFDAVEGVKTVGGIVARNSLEALQLVFEHELCHAIEFINFKTSSCRQPRFKTMARNLFGHTASYHQLPTRRQIAEEHYGFKLGTMVAFPGEDREIQGMLYRIQKRAVVMVKDRNGNYRDKQGNRYVKYYVPLKLLKKV